MLRLIEAAADVSVDSTTMLTTGAILVRNGKIISKGISTWERQKIGCMNVMTSHAETMAIFNSSRHAKKLLPSLFATYGQPQVTWGDQCELRCW